VSILNGPNLRSTALVDIESRCELLARELRLDLTFAQTDEEAQLIGWIYDAVELNSAVIINPGPSSIRSRPVLEALGNVRQKVIEVHLTHVGVLTGRSVTWGFIAGLGPAGYELALWAVA
jgi:3-dehydroquinate dehydratase II